MIKYFLKTFKILNENIILTTPLVFFLFLLSLYLEFSKRAPENIFSTVLLLCTILFMISAFFAGWFFMAKKAIEIEKQEFQDETEKAKASFGLLKDFTTGIGEYFLSFTGASILYFILLSILIFIVYKTGMHFIGDVNLNLDQMKKALESPQEIKMLLSSLPQEQLIRINAWNLLIIATTLIQYFITMFWGAEIVYKTKNPIMALLNSIKSIFKKPFSSIILFIYIISVNFMISFINTISTGNSILYFVSMLLYFYFLAYIIVLIFLYYENEIIRKNENNSNSWPDSIGQEQPSDSNSEGS